MGNPHHIYFNLYFPYLEVVMKDVQAFLPLPKSFCTFLSFRDTSDYLIPCFLGRLNIKLPLILKGAHLLDQSFSFILSR